MFLSRSPDCCTEMHTHALHFCSWNIALLWKSLEMLYKVAGTDKAVANSESLG